MITQLPYRIRAKSIYDIDLKSWAKELTNAIVEAWSKGEDAAKAYHDKVRDLMKTLTTNILAQKVMEHALEPVSKFLTKTLTAKSGKLDGTDIVKMADMVSGVYDSVSDNIINFLNEMKRRGWDLSQNGSSSIGNGIKSITEETANILASYLDQCRADLSVVRNLQATHLPQLSEVAKSQLAQLIMISQHTLRNAEAAERIDNSVTELSNNIRQVINGTKQLHVR